MFTGIVEEAGEVVDVTEREGDPGHPEAGGRRIRVAASFCDDLSHGQSIAVSGVCLTVEDWDEESFELFLSRETLARTSLDAVAVGDRVNLERALPADGRFDGHFVQGHVDGTGEVLAIEQAGGGSASDASGASSSEQGEYDGDWELTVSLPASMGRYVVEKGSIAADGISLTVADLQDDRFTVAIVPATYDLTNLSEMEPGDPVNLEVDVVAKYVESLVKGYQQ